jgi:predicted lipoprotein with Yx(FWY)xxD motif
MRNRNLSLAILASAALLALGLAACGGGSNNSDSTTASSAGGADSGSTVSTQTVGGASLLVDSKGAVLYTNDQDTSSKVACSGACTSIWVPLPAPSSGQPSSSDSAVQAKLGVIKLPGGGSQVTFDGKPLYTFVQDGAGEATGDGVTDSFGGTTFTWTAASVSGAKPAGGAAPTTTSSGGGSSSGGGAYGGGGY